LALTARAAQRYGASVRLFGAARALHRVGCAPFRLRDALRSSTLRLHGLRGTAEVLTDGYGVPHIYADSAEDLFFAQGFVTVRDRMFQMDYNRHGARGRLCELVGRKPIPWRRLTVHLKNRTTLDVDRMMRSFGLERAAEQSLLCMAADSRRYLDAYVAGVNAYLDTQPWTVEHRLLWQRMRPWDPVDSLVMVKAIAFELNYAWRAILLGGMLQDAQVPEDIAARLWPQYPASGPSIVEPAALTRSLQELHGLYQAAGLSLGIPQHPGAGSNSFVVAASHSQSGRALLANDTHLTLTAPVAWHEVRLCGGGFDLHGFSLPGLPGIGIGRNPHHAWGITAALVQDLDLFVEELDGETYRTPEGWQNLASRDEVFRIRGEGYETHRVRESRHGPLLETLHDTLPENLRYAVCWTGHTPASELDTLIEICQADSRQAFHRALRHHGCPTFSISYAGADGRIAYFMAGRIPQRRRNTPLRPLEGWTGEWDWQGLVPFADNPCELDPARGFIVTANNRVAAIDHELGSLFEPPERFERITERLEQLGRRIGLDDLQRLQCDVDAGWGRAVQRALLRCAGEGTLRSIGPEANRAVGIWLAWDGQASIDAVGATLSYLLAYRVAEAVVRHLAGQDAAHAFVELGSFTGPTIAALPAIQGRLAALGIDLPALVVRCFSELIQDLVARFGKDPSTWTWGRVHSLQILHRFNETPLGAWLSIGPEPAPGGPDTVNRGDFNPMYGTALKIGPAMRLLLEAGARIGWSVVPGGQSGRRLSPHYDDQLPLFMRGELKRVVYERDELALSRPRAEVLVPQ
jgi:penicillin amidase